MSRKKEWGREREGENEMRKVSGESEVRERRREELGGRVR